MSGGDFEYAAGGRVAGPGLGGKAGPNVLSALGSSHASTERSLTSLDEECRFLREQLALGQMYIRLYMSDIPVKPHELELDKKATFLSRLMRWQPAMGILEHLHFIDVDPQVFSFAFLNRGQG